jgi:hypothetical protein
MSFKLIFNTFNVNSKISGIFTLISILQQLDMEPPHVPTGDCSININFVIEMSLDEIIEAGPKDRYRASSTLHKRIPMRSPQDIEAVAVRLSKLVTEWDAPWVETGTVKFRTP